MPDICRQTLAVPYLAAGLLLGFNNLCGIFTGHFALVDALGFTGVFAILVAVGVITFCYQLTVRFTDWRSAAWSVGWGILCLLLIVLWVRSYWWFDAINYRQSRTNLYQAQLEDGVVRFKDFSPFALDVSHQPPIGWSLAEPWYAGYDNRWINVSLLKQTFPGFGSPKGYGSQIPYWSLIVATTVLGALPWFRVRNFHFSLRTLLIGMTVIAAVLGLLITLRGS